MWLGLLNRGLVHHAPDLELRLLNHIHTLHIVSISYYSVSNSALLA